MLALKQETLPSGPLTKTIFVSILQIPLLVSRDGLVYTGICPLGRWKQMSYSPVGARDVRFLNKAELIS